MAPRFGCLHGYCRPTILKLHGQRQGRLPPIGNRTGRLEKWAPVDEIVIRLLVLEAARAKINPPGNGIRLAQPVRSNRID
jgi:hypothetical protein